MPASFPPCKSAVPLALLLLFCLPGSHGQDARVVTEPSFPVSCAVLPAQLTIVGGEPSSETSFDTSRIQAALNACNNGEAVELVALGTNNAFLTARLALPTGVTLLIDAGVTLFASRNPQDYQEATGETCGTIGTLGNGCHSLISSSQTSGAGIMGYGILDGRGKDNLIVNGVVQNYSWYSNTTQAVASGTLQNNPDLLDTFSASNFTLYKITFRNSPHFNVLWSGKNYGPSLTTGLTVWGIKIIAPYTATNTDGIDPVNNIADVTIANSYISNGDDQIAISANDPDNPASNITVKNLRTYSGRGVSLGSFTKGGISNVLVDTVNQAGNSNDQFGDGFRIKSAADRGGLVNNVTFQNICQQNEMFAIRIYPYYVMTNTGYIPTYQNITVRNVTILPNAQGFSGKLVFQGFDANHVVGLTLDNVNVANTPQYSPAPQYTQFSFGGGPVNPLSLQGLSGSGISYVGSIANPTVPPYPCTAANFVPLAGELVASVGSVANLKAPALAYGSSFTLNAVVEAASSEYPTPTSPITFLDGGLPIGSAALAGNGTLAALTISNAAVGTHTYTAQYPADGNFPLVNFGSVTVTISSGH